jgi:hypothetical protein
MNHETSGNASALVTSSKYNNGFKFNQSNPHQEKECDYCHRQGHIKKNCFAKKKADQNKQEKSKDSQDQKQLYFN